MGSTFGGLNIATTSLAAQRRAIETAGHNIANVNTSGYSRQRVDMVAHTSGGSGIHTGTLTQPGGVDIAAQTRITDIFVTERLNRETAAQGSTDVLRQTFGSIESAFNEPGENGLAAQMEGFWDAWDTVVTRPEDLSVRTALLQKAQAVADGINSLSARIGVIATDALDRAGAVVADVNRLAQGIGDLNGVIAAQLAAGEASNDLLDRRDQLVKELSGHLQVSTRMTDNGMMSVSVAGSNLVSGTRTTGIHLDTSTAGAAVLRLDGSNTEVRPTTGTIPTLLDVANRVVPDQLAGLTAFAVTLADDVNALHATGTDLLGNAPATADLFTVDANGLSVAAGVAGNPGGIRAAAAGAGLFDGGNASAIANLAGGRADSQYRSLVAQLGVQANGANTRASLQDQVVQEMHAERDAISGVSLDEEMTNLIAFQQAYQASARYLTAVDEMLSTLINSTGLVGR